MPAKSHGRSRPVAPQLGTQDLASPSPVADPLLLQVEGDSWRAFAGRFEQTCRIIEGFRKRRGPHWLADLCRDMCCARCGAQLRRIPDMHPRPCVDDKTEMAPAAGLSRSWSIEKPPNHDAGVAHSIRHACPGRGPRDQLPTLWAPRILSLGVVAIEASR
ncbi:hypothetical protein VUR80DRAFT_6583 [Thermomyces stellatus]